MNRPTLIEEIRKLNETAMANLKKEADFVGTIFDKSSPSGELPVALVIGINYGQTETSKSDLNQNEAEIGYAKRVRDICKSETGEQEFQVVLWNFYPFLTDSEWTEEMANCAVEAQFLFDKGYKDPLGEAKRVIESLRPKVIILHGFHSAVQVLGRLATEKFDSWVFSAPNLSRGAQVKKTTLVKGSRVESR